MIIYPPAHVTEIEAATQAARANSESPRPLTYITTPPDSVSNLHNLITNTIKPADANTRLLPLTTQTSPIKQRAVRSGEY